MTSASVLGALILTSFVLMLLAGLWLCVQAGRAGRDAWRAIRRR